MAGRGSPGAVSRSGCKPPSAAERIAGPYSPRRFTAGALAGRSRYRLGWNPSGPMRPLQAISARADRRARFAVSKRVPEGYPQSVARQTRPCFSEVDLQRITASVLPDYLARIPPCFDVPRIGIAPGEIERHIVPYPRRETCRQHNGEIDFIPARNNRRRPTQTPYWFRQYRCR